MKRRKIDLAEAMQEVTHKKVEWRKTAEEGLDVDYALLLPRSLADELMKQLQETVQYFEGELSKIKVFDKWHNIPRQQAAYGDEGVSYKFSGLVVPAKPWIPALEVTRNFISKITGTYFNFVLANRYRNGLDHIGEHRDNEVDLDHKAPIASLSLGQQRTFVLKHGDVRKKGDKKRNIPLVKIELQHGSILLMNPPTNKFWYHSVPPRKNSPGVRINLTFRDIYGQIWVFHLLKIIKPDNSTQQERLPKNVFTVEEDVQINSLVTMDNYLVVGTEAWKVAIPNNKDKLEKCDINCMAYNKLTESIYLGCGDNNIYSMKIEGGEITQTLNGHTNYIHSLCNIGNELVSGGEDGLVNIWDARVKSVINKIEPYKNDKIARPELGKWIGAVGFNDDWLVCGGGPRLSMWHLRTLNTSVIFPIENRGIHIAEFKENHILAGGTADYFYNLSFNGDVVSEIPISSVTVFSAIHHDSPFSALCLAGSSPKVDICSNFNYRDQVLSLY
ncbi:putative THO complex [Trypoxylus dichotomus]